MTQHTAEQDNTTNVKNSILRAVAVAGVMVGGLASSDTVVTSEKLASKENVIQVSGEDPWVTYEDGTYYYTTVDRDERGISVAAAGSVEQFKDAALQEVWGHEGAGKFTSIWAPELHHINDKWYLYYAADDGTPEGRRMHVAEANNPTGPFSYKGKVQAETDRWAIDGTVLQQGEDLYFLWSGWEGEEDVQQNLYIAKMKNPWTIEGERVMISSPEHGWEKKGGRPLVNEAPQVLKHNGRTFIVYSASGSWSDYYCLGQLELVGNNPMDPDAWFKNPDAVFVGTDEIPAPGHESFTTSKDGKKYIIVYHNARYPGAGWDREVRAQTFTWRADGTPDFGTPRGTFEP